MQNIDSNAPLRALGLLFLLSGVAALIYQVAWQRVLFAAFGSDIESVAIVVSAFMLGLGTGALCGGSVADRFPRATLRIFAGCEVGIGLYGLVSVFLMRWAGDQFVGLEFRWIALINFSLVLLPSLLMGATLPVLVSYTARAWGNIGSATGYMYALNTFGAACGAFTTAFLLFDVLTIELVVAAAAVINLSVAVFALGFLGARK